MSSHHRHQSEAECTHRWLVLQRVPNTCDVRRKTFMSEAALRMHLVLCVHINMMLASLSQSFQAKSRSDSHLPRKASSLHVCHVCERLLLIGVAVCVRQYWLHGVCLSDYFVNVLNV